MMPGAGDGATASPGGERVEEADDGALGAAGRPQSDGDLGDHAERALGADHERREVVARRRPSRYAGRAGRSRRCR